MPRFEFPVGDRVRARSASQVLERQVKALPEAAHTAFRTCLAGPAKTHGPTAATTGTKGETKAETRAETKAP